MGVAMTPQTFGKWIFYSIIAIETAVLAMCLFVLSFFVYLVMLQPAP